MLTDEEKREIERLAAENGHYGGASIDALKVVQKHRGWVSDEALRDVAAALRMTPAELDKIATSWTLIFRRPVGKHVVLFCDSVSCWITGSDALQTHLEKRLGIPLGGTSADGAFTLLPMACLAACDLAPCMMIDEELYGPLTAEGMDRVIESYLKGARD